MSSVNFSLRNFYDSGIEYIGIKSGLLLDKETFRKIILEKYKDQFLHDDNLDLHVRIKVDDIEDMFVHIRRRIGNLPQTSDSEKYRQVLWDYVKKIKELEPLASSTSLVYHYLQGNNNATLAEIAAFITKETRYPIHIATAMAHIGLERNDQSCVMPPSLEWNKTKKLSELFNCEIKSETVNEFIEQKFIDYLAVNGHEIEIIHWRNFERFCAEYFKRKGYHVVLGPGTNDGGVDIRAFKDKATNSAPHVLIQCKRYKAENKISIDTVKAFYTDVLYEKANHGLIATSSHISPGGKSICKVRGYNLKFAEAEKVKNWGQKMWTYKTQD